MGEAIMGFSTYRHHLHLPKLDTLSSSKTPMQRLVCMSHISKYLQLQYQRNNKQSGDWRRGARKVSALPDWPLMAVMIEHVAGQRDYIVHKSVWHLSDAAMKNVYTMYIMFTCWGCCFFGAMKDPFYDGEAYRKDGGDGTSHWYYEKQEDIEAEAREELWREELIEEIEKKVGGLRELEEAGREEELVK